MSVWQCLVVYRVKRITQINNPNISCQGNWKCCRLVQCNCGVKWLTCFVFHWSVLPTQLHLVQQSFKVKSLKEWWWHWSQTETVLNWEFMSWFFLLTLNTQYNTQHNPHSHKTKEEADECLLLTGLLCVLKVHIFYSHQRVTCLHLY